MEQEKSVQITFITSPDSAFFLNDISNELKMDVSKIIDVMVREMIWDSANLHFVKKILRSIEIRPHDPDIDCINDFLNKTHYQCQIHRLNESEFERCQTRSLDLEDEELIEKLKNDNELKIANCIVLNLLQRLAGHSIIHIIDETESEEDTEN